MPGRALVTLALLLTAASCRSTKHHAPSLSALLRDTGSAATPLTAHLIARAADCTTRLEFLTLLQRPAISRSITLGSVWVVGSAVDVDSVASAMARRDLSAVPMHRATAAIGDALSVLGVAHLPVLVLADSVGVIRFVASSPDTPVAYAELATTLSALNPRLP